ncbi:MAG: OmpH family outer membrane protein [Myxococcota bacterium]
MTLLFIDLAALLDQSKVGAEAAKALEQQWAAGQEKPDDQKRALWEKLQAQRDSLRKRLLERARPHVEKLAKAKKAVAVLEKSVVVWGAGEDITAQVIAQVDAQGPLEA